MIIGEYSPRLRPGEYSPIITEPEANNCFSINTQVIFQKREKENISTRNHLHYSGKTTNARVRLFSHLFACITIPNSCITISHCSSSTIEHFQVDEDLNPFLDHIHIYIYYKQFERAS